MERCHQSTITAAAFKNLKGIEFLDVAGCKQITLGYADIVRIVGSGVELIIGECDEDSDYDDELFDSDDSDD
jgi:hypothetical protein